MDTKEGSHPAPKIITGNGVRVVFMLLGVFTLLFTIVLPSYMAFRYGNFWHALDFFRMPMRGGDFLATYDTAKHWLAGLPAYSTPDSLGRLYSYPIVHVLLFVPLTLLPFEQSYQVWSVISVGLTGLSVWFTSKLYVDSPRIAFALGVLLLAQSSFIIFQLERGQTDALVLFLITAFLYLYLRGHSKALVAAILVLASVLKVFPAVWGLFFLLRREFKLLGYAFVFSIFAVVCTNPLVWWKYITETVPSYSEFYLGYTVDHSLFYLADWLIPIHREARTYAKILSCLALGIYALNVIFNRSRDRYVLTEIALLTIIMEISTPWAANYKLLLLLFALLTPLSIQAFSFVQRRPLFFTLPIFLCFVLIVPLFGEYLVRIPYTVLAHVSPSLTIPFNPLNPLIADRKVALGVLLLLMYLLLLYSAATVQSYLSEKQQATFWNWFDRITRPRNVSLVVALLALTTAVLSLEYHKMNEAGVTAIVAETNSKQFMGPAVTGLGYRVTERGSGYHTLDLVFEVHEALPRNYQIYVHAYGPNASGGYAVTSGKNFFPDLITSAWPKSKIVHTQTTLPVPNDYTELHVGFFSLEDGARYGPEAVFIRR
jgi:hypothetical protein